LNPNIELRRRERPVKSMRLILLVLAVGLVPVLVNGQSATDDQLRPAITNADVVEMHVAGLSDKVIVAKLATSTCDCDTTPTSLSKLKAAGVSESVILAMIEHKEGPAPNNQMKQGQAILHLYRESAYVGSLRTMPIFIDEVQVAALVNGRQFSMTVDPGKHVFRCRTKDEAIIVDIKPGEEYYLRAELIQTFAKNHWHIVQVTSEQGDVDIKTLKPLDPKDITPLARGAKLIQEN